ncbi:M20/M25/M40 family metallo-hydrolase [Stenotrophomonas sp. MMGLT7]|uniref:M20/M25/M40 family metallo-hydrolase n=1 Tax=Stenotrophomonas sp. MMGLT7 TaxID=2901227 RepID=UPI001E3FDCA3|nr:M20/M25/M40 family metallo-hydrolase [Stenotrophomonas sp. MMGLT7]MCD7098635.1 M20/M25/M40 family metallo-hydrolase [Stenotrophomonas sp. MMGLT7]
MTRPDPRLAHLALCCALSPLLFGCSREQPAADASGPEPAAAVAAEKEPARPIDPLAVVKPGGDAAPTSPGQYQQLARELLAELVAIDTTREHGDTTLAANALARRFLAAGFAPADVHVVVPDDDPKRGNLVVRLPGSDPSLKPLLLLAHLDVVAADPEDWTLPPFELTEKDGAFFGRGVADDKDDAAIYAANLIRMKQEGYAPRRGIVLALTADEEGGRSNGVDLLLQRHRELVDAAFVFNEGGGGVLDESGRRVSNAVQAAEKRFQSYVFEATNPGGHSSRPRDDNAIVELGKALTGIHTRLLPVRLNEVTREYLQQSAAVAGDDKGRYMTALARDPEDRVAADVLSADPVLNATIRTTCTPTLIEGGHAENALPQRAQATVNCRLVPGDEPGYVRERLQAAAGDAKVSVRLKADEETPSPVSPVGGEVLAAVSRITGQMWPGVPVVPTMSTGATDSRYFRIAGIPAYGVSGLFYAETGAHGMNERVPVQSFYEGQEFLYRLAREVSAE